MSSEEQKRHLQTWFEFMEMDLAIKAEAVGKVYKIGRRDEAIGGTARDLIVRQANVLSRSFRDLLRGRPIIAGDRIEEFHALRDVSFEVARGEVLGILGSNGAGKSTLLKLLSRITDPSSGKIEIRGRVASLLEVGTGFHPELTGRENIYLNGAILGMNRAEITNRFEQIVDFAEVHKFLDTPVKRYSSGMYIRLAFAIAAHLEPDVLIVDEVLAVGDAEFQQKCLGKMQDVAAQGRTVIFVSHNIAAVRALCNSAMLLRDGRFIVKGSVQEVYDMYFGLGYHKRKSYECTDNRDGQFIREIRLIGEASEGNTSANSTLTILVRLNRPAPPKTALGIEIFRSDGVCVLHVSDEFAGYAQNSQERVLTLPPFAIGPGDYSITAIIAVRNVEEIDRVEHGLTFSIQPSRELARMQTGSWNGPNSPEFGEWSFS